VIVEFFVLFNAVCVVGISHNRSSSSSHIQHSAYSMLLFRILSIATETVPLFVVIRRHLALAADIAGGVRCIL
jgi:hypothetical protein